ncbi:MAG: hypothetical protein ACLSFI_09535 [Christensenellaceae bacterium]
MQNNFGAGGNLLHGSFLFYRFTTEDSMITLNPNFNFTGYYYYAGRYYIQRY